MSFLRCTRMNNLGFPDKKPGQVSCCYTKRSLYSLSSQTNCGGSGEPTPTMVLPLHRIMQSELWFHMQKMKVRWNISKSLKTIIFLDREIFIHMGIQIQVEKEMRNKILNATMHIWTIGTVYCLIPTFLKTTSLSSPKNSSDRV